MNKRETEQVAFLEENLRLLFAKQQTIRRWKKKSNPTPEYLPEHHFKMAFLVQILLAMEWRHGNQNELDGYRLLQCAINHDLHETIIGDVPWAEKNGLNGLRHRTEERNVFIKLFTRLVPECLRRFFPLPLDMDDEISPLEVNREFWNAAEIVGYLYFALAELRRPNATPQHITDFEMVFGQQWETLHKYMETFPNSIGEVGNVILAERAKLMGESPPQVNEGVNTAPLSFFSIGLGADH